MSDAMSERNSQLITIFILIGALAMVGLALSGTLQMSRLPVAQAATKCAGHNGLPAANNVRLDSLAPAGSFMRAMLLRRVAFPDFCEPCLPSPAAKPPAGDGWLHEIKHDGFRMLVRR